jgi:hypothetical protein
MEMMLDASGNKQIERTWHMNQNPGCPQGGMEKLTNGDKSTQPRPHRIPESLSAFCNIVSFTAANTSLMLLVSVAWVRLFTHKQSG